MSLFKQDWWYLNAQSSAYTVDNTNIWPLIIISVQMFKIMGISKRRCMGTLIRQNSCWFSAKKKSTIIKTDRNRIDNIRFRPMNIEFINCWFDNIWFICLETISVDITINAIDFSSGGIFRILAESIFMVRWCTRSWWRIKNEFN